MSSAVLEEEETASPVDSATGIPRHLIGRPVEFFRRIYRIWGLSPCGGADTPYDHRMVIGHVNVNSFRAVLRTPDGYELIYPSGGGLASAVTMVARRPRYSVALVEVEAERAVQVGDYCGSMARPVWAPTGRGQWHWSLQAAEALLRRISEKWPADVFEVAEREPIEIVGTEMVSSVDRLIYV